MQKKRNTKSTLKPIELLLVLVCTAGMAVSLYLLQKDITISLSKKDEKPIAVIYFKYNTVQRRFEDRNLWDELKQSSPLYDGDRIRTASYSEAYTVFNDGTKIELHENSLIQIHAKENALDFLKGSVSISAPVGEDKISVRTGDKKLKLSNNTTAVLNMPATEKGEASIAVTSGAIEVIKVAEKTQNAPAAFVQKMTETVTGKPSEQNDDTIVETVTAGKAVSYTPLTPTMEQKQEQKANDKEKKCIVYMPATTSTATAYQGKETSVVFFWNADADFSLQFSSDSSFNSVESQKKLEQGENKASVPLEFAKPGKTIFWRVVGDATKAGELLPQGVIVVRNAVEEEKALTAAAKEAFGEEKATIVASAVKTVEKENMKVAEQLPLAVSQTVAPELQKTDATVPTVSPDVAEKNVKAPVKDTASEKKSVPVTTVVAEKKTTPVKKTAPVKRTAADKKKTTPVKKVEAVVQTADKANENQTKQSERKKSVVTVQPAKTVQSEKNVQPTETAQSTVTVQPEKNVQPAETAKISESEKSPAVEPTPEIKKEEPVVTVGTPSIYSPEMKKVFTENDFSVSSPQITFSWSEVPDTTWYLFTLYQGSDLTKKIAMYKVIETTFSLKEDKLSTLDNGVYTWTVTAICDRNGKRYFGSPVEAQFSLSISDVDTVNLDTSQLIDAR